VKAIKITAEYDRWERKLKDRKAVARIRVRIDRLALGNPGQTRNLAGGVSEIKIDFGPGYRIYFTERRDEIVILLCGGTKKTQDKDIEQARSLAARL